MTTEQRPWITFPPDWRWITVGFCYFVLGHLFPISVLDLLSVGHGVYHNVSAVWSYGGLAAIAFVIGYRSRNIAVLEAAIASTVYVLMINGAVANKLTDAWKLTGFRWMIIILAITIVSATIGEVVQSVRERYA
jgi:hypothetical protein